MAVQRGNKKPETICPECATLHTYKRIDSPHLIRCDCGAGWFVYPWTETKKEGRI